MDVHCSVARGLVATWYPFGIISLTCKPWPACGRKKAFLACGVCRSTLVGWRMCTAFADLTACVPPVYRRCPVHELLIDTSGHVLLWHTTSNKVRKASLLSHKVCVCTRGLKGIKRASTPSYSDPRN